MNVHLIADLECQRWLDSVKAINRFMTDIVSAIGLTEEHRWLKEFNDGSEFGRGVTCLVGLSESGIMLHTALERQMLNLDVFSCKEFDVNAVSYLCRRYFRTSRVVRWEVLQRC